MGSTFGGTPLTLTGTGFTANEAGTNTVTVGGQACTGANAVSDTEIDCTSPAGTAGTVDVVVTNANGVATLEGGYTYTVSVCGDNIAEGTEVCDGTDLAGEDCVSQGFTGGTLTCLEDCSGFDKSSCTGCGNDMVEPGEFCDGDDLGDATGATCVDFGFIGGTLACNATCDNLDLTDCTGGPPGWTCPVLYYGNFDGCDCGCGVIDPDCGDVTVSSCDYCGGPGSCSPIYSSCPGDIDPGQNWLCGSGTAVCGDGMAEPPEECDGIDLQGLDCTDLGFAGGVLACTGDCTFDTSSCTAICGNDVVETGEICDGTDLQGVTCADFGFTGGTLACNATCNNWDITGCTSGPPVGWTCLPEFYGNAECDCGCGVPDLDCADDTLASCDYCGFPGSCSPLSPFVWDCPGNIDPAQNWLCLGGTAVCGNDVAEAPEVCDGTDLQGVTCADFGLTGGTLACNATCNNWEDITGCTGGPPVPEGWTCVPQYYGAADGCDCGCGVRDPDCADDTLASCDYCGVEGSCSPLSPFVWNCPGDIDPAQNWLCLGGTAVCGNDVAEVPEVCDAADLQGVTCADFGFDGGTLACNATCDNWDFTGCTSGPPVPDGWTCIPEYYGAADGCDCGCGVRDPDCADDTVASCDYCGALGSCSPIYSSCPGDIDPAQNWLCGNGGTGGTGGA
jgi:hypothetical protein